MCRYSSFLVSGNVNVSLGIRHTISSFNSCGRQKKQKLFLSTNIERFQQHLSPIKSSCLEMCFIPRDEPSLISSYANLLTPGVTDASLVFLKMAQYSFTLTHAAISYSFAGEEATAIKAFKLWFNQMFRFTFFIHLLLWLCVKQHNGGFVPAIWSTVNYSWPVDAMPTTASKWITLCWRIMDIYSSGILFTIFCKK